MSETSGGQMTLDVVDTPKPQSVESSAERKCSFEGTTRDPNIPVQLEGMTKPGIIPVRLTLYNPDFQDFIGPFFEPRGEIALVFFGVESDFNKHHYWPVEIKEALKDPKTGRRNRLDQEFVETHKDAEWYVSTRDVVLDESKQTQPREILEPIDPQVEEQKERKRRDIKDWKKENEDIIF